VAGKTEATGMLENLSGETRLFPIIGDPIIFVKIPPRLTGDLEARGHNGICVPMQVPETDLEGVMNGLSRIPNIDGLLITMPHKFTAFAYCATSSERAKLLGVVSVMRRNPDGSWHGDMLDGLAFVKAQKNHAGGMRIRREWTGRAKRQCVAGGRRGLVLVLFTAAS
jgi:shikimate dehydrogenase